MDESWQNFFEGFELGINEKETSKSISIDESHLRKELAVHNLIHGYRTRGHLLSKTNPVRERRDRNARLKIEDYSLSTDDLKKVFRTGSEIGMENATLEEILKRLDQIYTGPIGFEYMSIREPEIFEWFKKKVEQDFINNQLNIDEKKRILSKLNEAVVFESFLHTKYVGQKRFSLEGGESTIPALDAIINHASNLGVEEVLIGMAHRGRLNVLANIMQKTYAEIFNEFEGTALPDETMGGGDVKYHKGYASQVKSSFNKEVILNLLPNPSHLEAIDPVIIGNARAKIDAIYNGKENKVLPILIHGDGAIAAQGIVYETLQMSNLPGYSAGGTIHFVINNQVSFTTDFDEARSSTYCTDISQLVEAPEIHVNGDDPEAVIFATKLAVEFRQKFNRDIFIDMVCYRKHGHNESDEPKFTQPKLYSLISKHPNPREIYNKKLLQKGDLEADAAIKMDKEFRKLLNDRFNEVRQNPLPYKTQKFEVNWKSLRKSSAEDFEKSPSTKITHEVIDKVGKALTKLPKGYKPIRQIDKLIKERKQMFFDDKKLNWASAELLAYGSIVLENKKVRLSGQDVERGTFSHRHAVLKDIETGEKYESLNHIEPEKQETCSIYNSLLSEYGVLGFEFGYSAANPNSLVIWEAQFGDFANGAQTIIDQFITSCESKWDRMSGLVLLLPHGYEGQGPEHSNARPERFLQLSAEYNIIVANITKPSNFFHLLRRQVTWPFRKPCIVMSPKSLLRHPEVVSPLSEFTKGGFNEIYDDSYVDKSKTEKVLLCTGKIYYDLLKKQKEDKIKNIAIIRVEQLYPFPHQKMDNLLGKYKKLKRLIWVQEEPENMGYWSFILRTFKPKVSLEVISRKASASPATGFHKVHQNEQEKIIETALMS